MCATSASATLDNLFGVRFLLLAPLLFEALLLEAQLLLTVANLRRFLELLRLDDGIFLLLFDLADLVVRRRGSIVRRQRRLQLHAQGPLRRWIDGLYRAGNDR